MIALPPFLYKYTKLFTFAISDPESPGQSVSISSAIYDEPAKRLFLADDKGYVRCIDITPIIIILEGVAEKYHHPNTSGKALLTPPKFDDIIIELTA